MPTLSEICPKTSGWGRKIQWLQWILKSLINRRSRSSWLKIDMHNLNSKCVHLCASPKSRASGCEIFSRSWRLIAAFRRWLYFTFCSGCCIFYKIPTSILYVMLLSKRSDVIYLHYKLKIIIKQTMVWNSVLISFFYSKNKIKYKIHLSVCQNFQH